MKDGTIKAAAPICPNCHRPAQGTPTKYGIRWDCWSCRTRAWDDKPMVPRQTLRARAAAHAAFDPLWQQTEKFASEEDVQRLLARSYAYKLLAEDLGLDEQEVHMGVMSEAVAVQVPDAVERIKARLALRTHDEILRDYRDRGREISETRKRRTLR